MRSFLAITTFAAAGLAACATSSHFDARELALFLKEGNYTEIASLEAALSERLEAVKPAAGRGYGQKYEPIGKGRVEYVRIVPAPPIDESNGIVMVRQGNRLAIQFSSRDCLPLPELEAQLGVKAKRDVYSVHVLDQSSGHYEWMPGPLEATLLLKTKREPLHSSAFLVHVSTFLHLQLGIEGDAQCIRSLGADLTSRVG